ncbi:hypothetical protein [Mucilaginibacter sp. 5C4]|nr:hypothetical protein [Mucilaginibacter sp. 5C4]
MAIMQHLISLNELEDKNKVRDALYHWYSNPNEDYQYWIEQHPADPKPTQYYKLERQHKWCVMADIKFTPTILINNYRLPDNYLIKDIKYLIAEQLDTCN